MKLRTLLGLISTSVLVMTLNLTGQETRTLSGQALVNSLRQGGYNIVLSSASATRPLRPSTGARDGDTVGLDTAGSQSSAGMGDGLKGLGIPVGEVRTSLAYRALETIATSELGPPTPSEELTDVPGTLNQSGQTAWLLARINVVPSRNNTFLMTHLSVISRAFPDLTGLSDGEALVFRPNSQGGANLVARVKIEEWRQLASEPWALADKAASESASRINVMEEMRKWIQGMQSSSEVDASQMSPQLRAGGNPSILVLSLYGPTPLYFEGAFDFLRINSAGSKVAEIKLTGETLSVRLDPGDYELVSYKRSCDGHCGLLDPPSAECRGNFSVRPGETLHALRLEAGTLCTITFSPQRRF